MIEPRCFSKIEELPQGTDVSLLTSSYFKHGERTLPTPAEVLAESAKQNSKIALTRASVPVTFKNTGLFVKYGTRVSTNEGQALWALKKYFGSSYPTPEVYGWNVKDGQTFLYLQYIDGITLKESWPTLSSKEKEALCRELRQILLKLRTAQQVEHSFVGNIAGQAVDDDIFEYVAPDVAGPFTSIRSFHDWFTTITARRRRPNRTPSTDPYRGEMIDDGPAMLTHGDIHGKNIMVSKGPAPRVMAVVDWQFAGWLPPYWEATKASSRNCDTGHDWVEKYVPMIFEGFPISVYWHFYADQAM